MILLSNDAAQTLAVGESATFSILRQTGSPRNPPSELFAQNGTTILLRGGGLYEVGFQANVTGATAAAPVQVSIQFAGGTLDETTAIYTPAVASAVGHISTKTFVGTTFPAQSFSVTVTNTGVNPIDISANPLFYARRVG